MKPLYRRGAYVIIVLIGFKAVIFDHGGIIHSAEVSPPDDAKCENKLRFRHICWATLVYA